MVVPQKVKHRITIHSQGTHLKELKTRTQTDTRSLVLTAASPQQPREARRSGHRCWMDRENVALTPRDAQRWKETKFCRLPQPGRNLKTLCRTGRAGRRRTDAVRLHLREISATRGRKQMRGHQGLGGRRNGGRCITGTAIKTTFAADGVDGCTAL